MLIGAAKRYLDHYFPTFSTAIRAHKEYFFGEPEIQLLRHLVPAEKVAIDVGANNGVYTYWLQKYAKSVIAIEPNPVCVNFLKRAFTDRVDVICGACSDHHGVTELIVPVVNGAENKYRGTIEKSAITSPSSAAERYRVNTFPLSDLNSLDIGFIKIDVEGHESAVLRGAMTILTSNRCTALVEAEERHRQGSVSEVMQFFADLDYKCFFVYRGQLFNGDKFDACLHQAENAEHTGARSAGYVNNFIFMPRERELNWP